jgi:hypothetical protein
MREDDGIGSRSSEPQRLVDDANGAGSASPWALDLLRGAAPYQSPAGRKQRVQLSLGHGAPRRAPLMLRTAVAAVVLFGCGAIASAALGRWPGWMARAYERLVPSSATRPTLAARSVERPRAVSLAPAPLAAPAAPLAVPPADVTRAEPRPSRQIAGAPHLHRTPPAIPVAAAATEDASPVLEAMRALRLERNPVHARALLARYLEQHPTGTLAEEALAMTIEAAVAHHDADATALSARYLRLYPLGPFRSLASQTLAGATP